ncbi:membrane protein [Streptomyces viridochromogenes]|uniref:Membrane protein n=1 Tax=Streptomyces viridochromogenes TaxID=1938 RepID=A0A0J7ZHU1_STRVR|nr:hypothetical protein [Streptomyces viridochromogenes]KMS74708.1 membrane protein [Streptomyces viridochromogenes]KOG14766.1 membrane protein [Streptomyces viridochromogenes]KOG14960.1 membrane protein [Streptomyces viridochromogenes]
MGIESDQVVYEYLSRVGDVAQQRQLPSGTRMRLVNELRGEIDRRRAKAAVDSPAAVRRIIARLGTPDEVVAAAGGTAAPAPQAPVTSVPVQPDGADHDERPKGLRRIVPRPRPAEAPARPDDAPPPPHLASTADLGGSALQPDWWRVDSSTFGPGEDVPGFVGGVEIPEMLRRPPAQEETRLRKKEPVEEPEADAVIEAEAEVPETSRRRRLIRRPTLPSGRWSNPLLLLAAALLVVGAVLGHLVVLLLGWLIAWGSRRLSDAETKWAVVILPGLSLTAGVVWLWGRTNGRWGDPIAEGHMNAALSETWPWVLRGAAVASALFIVWRSQRQQ